MKKLLMIAVALATVVTIGCSQKGGEARKVADRFAESYLVDYDADKYLKYCTDDFARDIRQEMLVSRQNNLGVYESLERRMEEHDFEYRYNEIESTIGKSTAEVIYNVTSKDDPRFFQKLILEMVRNANGQWRIADIDFSLD